MIKTQNKRKFVIESAKFISYSFLGLALSLIVFSLLHRYFLLSAFAANIIGDVVGILFMFGVSWLLIFTHNKNLFTIKLGLSISGKVILSMLISQILETAEFKLAQKPDLFEQNDVTLYLVLIKIACAAISLVISFFVQKLILEKF